MRHPFNSEERMRFRRKAKGTPLRRSSGSSEPPQQSHKGPPTADDWLKARWAAVSAIPIFPESMTQRRITIVTDSIGPSSLFGGVGTALILGALWAKRSKARLRIVTRTEAPETGALARVLAANNLTFDGQAEFRHHPRDGHRELAVGEHDLFLSTFWGTTRALLNTVGAKRIVSLLQDDERMFYPYGDERLECELAMAAPLRRVVVNTMLLRDHLTTGAGAIDGLTERAIAFEPAFIGGARKPDGGERKRRLLFYARPHNLRNLFATGVAALSEAILQGLLDSEAWEVHFVGGDAPEIEFRGGVKVIRHDMMGWREYKTFLTSIDAGFVLMYTPHPSYPPLDLAAMGVPVLTNQCGLKTDLARYSANILSAPLAPQTLVEGLGRLIALAEDRDRLEKNLAEDHICRDWAQALDPVVADLDTLW
ncbi:MAG: hypothetical protein E7774_14830 [Bradyrhizobium sp.]|nr:MAG: hypothetical protein E7774_14830 [Bradyrhizobium sp.]